MLNGRDPLLIITLKNKGILDFFGPESVTPGFADVVFDAIGLPIPIYFSPLLGFTEGSTGIFIDNESSAVDVVTRTDPIMTKGPDLEVEQPLQTQTCADAQLTINMVASRDSIILNVLLALMDLIISRLVTAEYSITYLNGPVAIFGAKLHRFGTNVSRNDTLVRIELVLSTAVKEAPAGPKAAISALAKITAPVPL